MNSSEKSFQQGVLISDENADSLWMQLHQGHRNSASPLRDSKDDSSRQKDKDYEFARDFIEVWMLIEEDIRIYENEKAKRKEEQTDILN